MSDKSYVTMAVSTCPVCGKEHETGDLLLDRRLRNTFDRTTNVGPSLCAEHLQQAKADDRIWVIGARELARGYELIGRTAQIRREAWPRIFNVPVPSQWWCFAAEETFDMLDKLNSMAQRGH